MSKRTAAKPLLDDHVFVVARILWEDAAHIPYWQDGNDSIEMSPVKCITIGVVIAESQDRITLAQTVAKDNHAHRIQIPTACIISIRVIGTIRKECSR